MTANIDTAQEADVCLEFGRHEAIVINPHQDRPGSMMNSLLIDAELLAGKKARNHLCCCKGFAMFCYMGLKEKQINFRPSEDGLALIDGLAGHFGISRSAVIELAVRRLAQHEQMLQSVFPGDISNLTLSRVEMSQPRKVSQKAKKRK